jgi:transcriptional regulator with XRE-family HTH domain
MLTPAEFGNRLRELRKSKNMTRKDLADRLFVSPPTISRWESGDRQPDISMLSKLAEVLEADIGELMADSEAKEPLNILVVDDEKIILTGNIRELRRALPEATVTGFSKSKDALLFAKSNKVQVAFLDIELRATKGIQLAKKLEEINPEINIIFVTSYMEYMEDAWKMYASGFILKPLTRERILGEMKNLRHPVKGLKL